MVQNNRWEHEEYRQYFL